MNPQRQPLGDKREDVVKSRGQFSLSLRWMVWITLACSLGALVLKEAFLRFGPVGAAASLLALLSVVAHVAGAAAGHRFSKTVGSVLEREEDSESKHLQPMQAKEENFAPATELSQQKPLNRKPIYWAVGVGATLGAILATTILTIVMWNNLPIGSIIFGASSAAVIGGLLGFWLSSFFQVVRSALTDAQKDT